MWIIYCCCDKQTAWDRFNILTDTFLHFCDSDQKPSWWPCSESSWLRGGSRRESAISRRVSLPTCQLHWAPCWRWLHCVWKEGALHLPAKERTYAWTNAMFRQSRTWLICTAGKREVISGDGTKRKQCWEREGRCIMGRMSYSSLAIWQIEEFRVSHADFEMKRIIIYR